MFKFSFKNNKDIPNAIYNWTLFNSTITPDNVNIESDVLLLKPFTKEVAGIYNCLAYNPRLNQYASKRININAESEKKTTRDVSSKIRIQVESSKSEFRKGGEIRLRCSIGKIYF